jgi:PAS domain S-box-containing protein
MRPPPDKSLPIEQAETRTQEANLRTDQANTSTDEANARTEQANARTAEANTRTEQADLRTEKAETQSASLSVSELSYRRLFESARDGILILDMVTGRITDANPFLIELLGFSHGEMLGKTVGELSPFKDILSNQAMLERLQKDGYIRYEDLPLETRDGRRISVEFVSNVYQVGDNEVIQCNIRDISERKGSEVALLASERKFRTLVANFPEIITRFDRQLRHLYVSPGIQKYTGISAEDFEGKTNEELGMPPDQAKVWKEQLNHVFETGMRGSHEFEFSHDNQRYVFTRLIVPEFGPDGKVETVMSIVHDITQRKLAETALRESEAFLKESQRIGSLGTYVTDFAIGRWSSSEVLDQILGIGPAYDHSVAGWAALIHPDDRALMVEYLEQEVFSQRQPFDKEYRIVRHNDQAERWVKGLGRMEFDAQGRPVKMIGTIQDITERKQADAALRQSEERYKALFNRSLDCVFLTDFAGNFLDANQASLNLLGFQHEDLSSLTFASLLTEDQLPSAFQTIEEIKATGHQQRLTEYRVRCKDGRQVYVETQSSLIHRDGKPFAIQGIARDITERKEVQAALIESERFNHATLDALGAHVAVLDGKGNILATNKAWREFALANTEDWKAVCEGANYLAVCDAAAKGDPDAAQAAKGIREVMANEKKT